MAYCATEIRGRDRRKDRNRYFGNLTGPICAPPKQKPGSVAKAAPTPQKDEGRLGEGCEEKLMFTDDKPHRRGPIHCQTVFWNGNSAGNEDNATLAVVTIGPSGLCWGAVEYRWPEQKHQVEKFERMLQHAFEYGKLAAKKEIRDVLGVVTPRS
jgi:hypothetical protein